jgi:16S rRNA processing protein RimM
MAYDLIDLGQVQDAQGLKGHIKVRPFSDDPVALLSCKQVHLHWLKPHPNCNIPPKSFEVLQARSHSQFLVLALAGIGDRDQALALKGAILSLERDQFPDLDPKSFYWVDLIGSQVYSQEGLELGLVEEIAEYGAHPVMKVGKELIPLAPDLIVSIEIPKDSVGKIVVKWQPNWSE